MMRLADIGEDVLVDRLLNLLPGVRGRNHGGGSQIVGAGDDCAVVDVGNDTCYQLLKTDSLVEGVHYLADAAAERVGWKAVGRVVSDFAAMGGRPDQLLATVVMPASTEVGYLEALYRGMQKCAAEFGAEIVGGETSSVPEGAAAVISIAGTGWVVKDRFVTRCGGKVGDAVLVTGLLGGSLAGKHLDFTPRMKESQWLVENYNIHAMMDLSDGLGQDLLRLAKASGCGGRVDDEAIPRNVGCDLSAAFSDGEDYELLFVVAPEIVEGLLGAWQQEFPELELSVIGELCELGQGDQNEYSGWEHFSQ